MKALYARISDDHEATGLGVLRQVEDCRGLAQLRDWPLQEYVDNDFSAFKRNVVRPEFERMLRDLASGVVDGVVVYNLDRLARQPRDLERVIDLYEDTPTLTFATLEAEVNLGSSDGRTMARVMVAFANKASADTGRRTKRKHRELAQAGAPVGRRMFGWQSDKRTLDAVEAKAGREVIDKLIAGTIGMREAARWLSAETPTTLGKDWSHQTLRNWLLNPRLTGWRTHYGQVVLNDAGSPVRGLWEPLVDQDTFDRLQLAIGPVRMGTAAGHRGARKYALSGLVRCAICRERMFGSNAREEGRFNYICQGPGHRVSVSGRLLDDMAFAMLYQRLAASPIAAPTPPEWDGAERDAEIGQQIEALMSAFLAGQLSDTVVFPRVEALERERSEMQNSRTRWLIETTGPAVVQESAESWTNRSDQQKRARAENAGLIALYILPARQRGVRFDPARVVLAWRGEPSPPAAIE